MEDSIAQLTELVSRQSEQHKQHRGRQASLDRQLREKDERIAALTAAGPARSEVSAREEADIHEIGWAAAHAVPTPARGVVVAGATAGAIGAPVPD